MGTLEEGSKNPDSWFPSGRTAMQFQLPGAHSPPLSKCNFLIPALQRENTQAASLGRGGSWSLPFCSPVPRTLVGGQAGDSHTQESSSSPSVDPKRLLGSLYRLEQVLSAPCLPCLPHWALSGWNPLLGLNLEEEQLQHPHSELLSLKQTARNMVMQSPSLLEKVQFLKSIIQKISSFSPMNFHLSDFTLIA